MLDYQLHGIAHKVGSQLHELVVQGAGIVGIAYQALLAQDNAAGVDVLVNHERSDAGAFLAVDYRPVDRGCAAVLRKQGCMQVEGAQFGHSPHFFGEHAEGYHHKHVGLQSGKLLQEGRVPELFGLQDWNAFLDRVAFDGALVKLEPASARLVGNGNHCHHLVFALDEGVQRGHRKLGRTHIDDAGLAEEACYAAQHLAPAGLECVHVEEFCIFYGLHRKEGPYRRQHVGRTENAVECQPGTVFGHLLARDLHNPVDYEEKH